MATPVYVDKADVVAILRSRELHGRADWVDKELPVFIDIMKNAALLGTLDIDPATLPHFDEEMKQYL
jgi:hypothetical protein